MKDDLIYIQHIADAIYRIEHYLDGVSYSTFESTPMVQDAVIRQLEIIGEASRNLSLSFRSEHSELPWAEIVALRNRLIHAYDSVNIDILWEIIEQDIPELGECVRRIVKIRCIKNVEEED